MTQEKAVVNQKSWKGLKKWNLIVPEIGLTKFEAVHYYHDNFVILLLAAAAKDTLEDAVEQLYYCR